MFSISLVTYHNDLEQIKILIESVLKVQSEPKFFIIDNSYDRKIQVLCKDYSVEYFFSGSNLGFGAAHNIAIKKAIQENSKYHFVINPDIYFDPVIIEKIVNFMDQNQDIGLLMPQIRYPEGSMQYLPKLLPSPFDLFVRRLGLFSRIFKKRLEKYELKQFSSCKTFNTPIVSGCFSCFRVEALKKIGLYDERFFMYFEDFDLSRRINKQYNTVYYSEVHVFHEYERGAQKSWKLFRIFIESAIKYFNKWGWFLDEDRKQINNKTLTQFNL